MIMPRRSLCLSLLWLVSTVSATPSSSSFWGAASFVPPASPTITSSSSPAPTQAVVTGYGTASTVLWAAKKKTASKKIQVKMLKHVAGTGSAGDVVTVTPAFFQNKLRPTKSAIPISDEEVEAEQSEKRAQEEAVNKAATKIKEQLSDFTLRIKRKAGPEGHLFGGVSPKVILEELRQNVDDPYLEQKQVKVISVTQGGKKIRHDIKEIGEFEVNLALTKFFNISVKFDVQVEAEN